MGLWQTLYVERSGLTPRRETKNLSLQIACTYPKWHSMNSLAWVNSQSLSFWIFEKWDWTIWISDFVMHLSSTIKDSEFDEALRLAFLTSNDQLNKIKVVWETPIIRIKMLWAHINLHKSIFVNFRVMITFNSGHVSGLAWFISLNFSISESELVLRLPIRLNPSTKLSISLFF